MDPTMMTTRKQQGITLLELMIVVAVIGILAAIGYPSYQDQVRRSNRTDAKSTLINYAALQERYFSNRNTYGSLTDLGLSATTEKGYYTIAVTPAAPTTTYTITATAVAASGQFKDTTCRELSITNTGARSSKNSAGTANSPDPCW